MTMAMETCPDCGERLTGNAPAGLCPRCLLQLGMGDGPCPTPGALSALEDSVGTVPRVHLRDDPDHARPVRPGSPMMPGLATRPTRYQLLGEVARGGMGAVFQGRDLDLGRDLAIKVIREDHRDHPEMVRRFIEEAQIGGQLQHPGVVPVHELGRLPDGRLYIAMKLIRGRTLAALLEGSPSPAEDRARFLPIFVQVCQTIAYAHSRGVIHRDIKPSNVMVGSFGEVQVMDWGLAKVLDQGGVADEEKAMRADDASAVRTLRTGSTAEESRIGRVLGTPPYMAPEQARGALDTLDERADVFALGSILCEILTGRPAFTGRSGAELHRKAERADLSDAHDRLDRCGADADLVALAGSCLAGVPKHRPRDAGVVVAALTAHLSGVERRLREAGLARARAEARASEERKRRLMTAALATSVLATALMIAAGWTWVDRDRRRRGMAVGLAVEAALDDASKKRGRARAAASELVPWVEAIEAARRAETLVEGEAAGADLRERVRGFLADLIRERDASVAAEKDRRMVERLAAIHNDLGVSFDAAKADSEYASAFRSYGVDVDALDPPAAGEALAASPMVADLANALDQWAFLRGRLAPRDPAGERHLLAVAKAADPDPWRNRLRDTLARMEGDPSGKLAALDRLADTADVARMPEASITRLAFALASLGRRETAIALLRRAQRSHPDDFWVNADLARELMHADRPDEAVRFYAVAAGVRPRSVHAVGGLGRALLQGGQVGEAVDTLRELVRTRPDDALSRVALGSALLRQGEPLEAEAEFREAEGLKPDDWMVRDQVASGYADVGDWAAAVAELRESARRFPSLAIARKSLGDALLNSGRADEAVVELRQAVRLDRRFAPAYSSLGRALIEVGDDPAALDAFSHAGSGPPWDSHRGRAASASRAGRAIALGPRLEAVARGDDRPVDGQEFADFARLAFARHWYETSARLWSAAFIACPAMASDIPPGIDSRPPEPPPWRPPGRARTTLRPAGPIEPDGEPGPWPGWRPTSPTSPHSSTRGNPGNGARWRSNSADGGSTRPWPGSGMKRSSPGSPRPNADRCASSGRGSSRCERRPSPCLAPPGLDRNPGAAV